MVLFLCFPACHVGSRSLASCYVGAAHFYQRLLTQAVEDARTAQQQDVQARLARLAERKDALLSLGQGPAAGAE